MLNKDLLQGAKEAADFCGLTETQIRHLVREGRLPVVRLGGRAMWFRKSELEAAFRSSTAA